jgi:ribonucleotide monophosphatase NagD (HAD superfamily)
MTLKIESILEISNKYDAIVFDQYGVLHDGKIPYLGAIECLSTLKKIGLKLAVLSNSGSEVILIKKEFQIWDLMHHFLKTL